MIIQHYFHETESIEQWAHVALSEMIIFIIYIFYYVYNDNSKHDVCDLPPTHVNKQKEVYGSNKQEEAPADILELMKAEDKVQ